MKSKKTEVKCPKCGAISYNTFKSDPKTCPDCLKKMRKDRRLDTKRRPASNPSCIHCGSETKFAYFIVPPHIRYKTKPPKRWCSLCDECWEYWLEKEDFPTLKTGPFLFAGFSSIDRPLTQDERDVLDLGDRAYSHDSETGLLTYEWRRPRYPST